MTDRPRFAPLSRDEWPEQMQAALEAMTPPTPRHFVPPPGGRPGRPKAQNTLGIFAHHPDLAQSWLAFNGHILYGTTLTLRQREILVLRVAAVLDSPFAWAQHIVHQEEAGLSDRDVHRIAFGPNAPFLDPLERAMIRSVDELIHEGTIAPATWEALAADLDEQQLLDLIFTVGCYTVLTWMIDTIGLEIDEDLIGTTQETR
jgi:alkylhydroperoxidase family enzyme